MRPCGIAMPCPRPVDPRRSRANRLSNTIDCGNAGLRLEQLRDLLEQPLLVVAAASSTMFDFGQQVRRCDSLREQEASHAHRELALTACAI